VPEPHHSARDGELPTRKTTAAAAKPLPTKPPSAPPRTRPSRAARRRGKAVANAKPIITRAPALRPHARINLCRRGTSPRRPPPFPIARHPRRRVGAEVRSQFTALSREGRRASKRGVHPFALSREGRRPLTRVAAGTALEGTDPRACLGGAVEREQAAERVTRVVAHYPTQLAPDVIPRDLSQGGGKPSRDRR
jgi:hypothetical protein